MCDDKISVTRYCRFGKSKASDLTTAMAIIQSGDSWQFRNECDLEEVIWRNLSQLLNLSPASRQFSISGKFCDILAVEPSHRLVIIELKNKEDRYVIQQLVRYYDALKGSALPFDIDCTAPPRLIVIAPSFHADSLIDCKYSTLPIELMTFSLQSVSGGFCLTLSDSTGQELSALLLQKEQALSKTAVPMSPPPRKLLNWLSNSSDVEKTWVLALRQQLLEFDPRMKEIVEPTQIFYGRGKSKPCCELRKNTTGGLSAQKVTYFLWLPDPENKPHVIKMHLHFDFEKHRVKSMAYGRRGYRSGSPWAFPKCITQMKRFGYQRSLALYQPFLSTNMTISLNNTVNLALKTWHSRI
jgi:hypothetical protein